MQRFRVKRECVVYAYYTFVTVLLLVVVVTVFVVVVVVVIGVVEKARYLYGHSLNSVHTMKGKS